MMNAGYLTQQEKADTIPLWKEAFPEDGPEFLDYYYREKTRDNRILAVWEEGEGGRRIISMIHRNPYRLWVNGRITDSDYIVAVATAEDRRHQGLMRMLLTRMLEDMHREGMPFCYLMPADRKIYEPFDFAYIYDQEHWRLTKEALKSLTKQKARLEDAGKAARWMEQWLEEQYQVFAFRDQDYAERLMAELESEKGLMELLYDGRELAGIRCLWGSREREQRMLLCSSRYREDEKEKTPAIMARITDLEKCLELIELKKDSPFDKLEIILSVEDKLCPWNCGTFLWKIGKTGSSVVRKNEGDIKEDQPGKFYLHTGIALLTQWVFGYRKPEEIICEKQGSETGKDERILWWKHINTWKNIFLDEVV